MYKATCISDLFAWKNFSHEYCDVAVTCFGKHSIRYISSFLWSKLAKDLKDLPNVATFINKIRKLNLLGYLSNNRNTATCAASKFFTHLVRNKEIYISIEF